MAVDSTVHLVLQELSFLLVLKIPGCHIISACRSVVLLDPPRNLSVSQTEQQGQLRVSWVPPEVKYMSDSMMYEVSYAPANGGLPQVSSSGHAPPKKP